MAAANITLINNPATIVCDETGAVITNGDDPQRTLEGVLVNADPAAGGGTVYIKFTNLEADPTAPATTDAQAQNIVGVPPGASFPVLVHYRKMYHIMKAGKTSALYWFPAQQGL